MTGIRALSSWGLVMLLVCWTTSAAAWQVSDDASFTIEASSRSAREFLAGRFDRQSPGIAVVVVKNGKPVFKQCMGCREIELSAPIQTNTLFSAASVSKQVTALAILILENEGRVALEETLSKYLPDLPDCYRNVTLRQLANHTSGVRSHKQLFGMKGLNPYDSLTNEMVHQIISDQQRLNFPPGTEFSYSNGGYALLARIIGKRAGMSFAEYVDRKILTPLEMHDSFFVVDFQESPMNLAKAYNSNRGNYTKIPTNDSIVGSTGLFTTLDDLTRWVDNFATPKAGTPALFAEMERLGVLKNGVRTQYGMGQFIDQHRGEKFIYHAGADAGFVAFVGRFPDRKMAVALLGNCSSFPARDLALGVVNEFLPRPAPTSGSNSQRIGVELSDSQNQKVRRGVLRFQKFYSSQGCS